MQHRQLGAGGPAVSAMGYGSMSFSGYTGRTDEAESHAILDAMLDVGMDFIDTANVYGMGHAETMIGSWLAARKPKVVIATKASIVSGPPRRIDNSEAHLRSELEGSLKRLGRDHVELFYLHRHQQDMPIEEAVGGVSRLIEEGKIGGYGLSEVSPATIRRAHATHPVTAVQNEYSLWTRAPELGAIQTCAELGIAFVPFSPLCRGMMSDTALLAEPDDWFRGINPRFHGQNFIDNSARVAEFRAFAARRGWSTPAAALAWVLDRGPHLIPLPGTREVAKLRQWPAACDIRLTDEDRAEIDRILPVGWAAGDRYPDAQYLAVERYC